MSSPQDFFQDQSNSVVKLEIASCMLKRQIHTSSYFHHAHFDLCNQMKKQKQNQNNRKNNSTEVESTDE